MSLVPQKQKTTGRRSFEVTRTYIGRGQAVSRSLWIRVSPKNALLKAAMALPFAVLMLTVFILILVVLGFALLAMALIAALSREKETREGE